MRSNWFEKKKISENLEVNDDNKIYFKDFIALCIAAFQIIMPVFIIVFIVFTVCVFLLMEFWTK